MEISITLLGNHGKFVRFPEISPTENVVKFHHLLRCCCFIDHPMKMTA